MLLLPYDTPPICTIFFTRCPVSCNRTCPTNCWTPTLPIDHPTHECGFLIAQGRRRESAILEKTKNYEDEAAPSFGYVQSNDDRKLCLQKRFELGQDCPAAYLGGAKIKVEPKKVVRKKQNPKGDQLTELVAGMEERRSFLEEMENAGMGEKYGAQIRVNTNTGTSLKQL